MNVVAKTPSLAQAHSLAPDVRIERSEAGVVLAPEPAEPGQLAKAVAAVAEALTAEDREAPTIEVVCADEAGRARLIAEAIVVPDAGRLVVRPELLWQRPSTWLAERDRPVYPELPVVTAGRRHPLRPSKPRGVVYARSIPWVNQTLRFRALEVNRDLALFHRWMNDPRVDAVWEEAGTLEAHRASLEERAADPHLLTLIGEFDGAPFGYFELYWAKENRLGPFYDADDHDRGWHVLIGEDAFRGKDFITAWLPSLMHYMFLDDPRTRRIVGEPRATHAQQIRNLDKAGFAKVKHFDFPHKRALLVMLLRERFFGDRLWAPEKTA
ncbi:RimJ/RimL family protein N-acetyltransferase [Methylopila capsulata]|uniref:RimJ/RimL family protein N-acetyltransferase n=1 Tax=Methylopila capsulata TaxID=61654 RepID=A0A9W6IXC6_9HYPH|nr:GNAT family N-acetyltransferase [Methylopila capsulata]MBM7853420.1 RimJ/RimL family protein N-acetyltransferase [Methylopila capsulata]GLK57367.1 hypothetical protein GCM10008170_33870 [Methylopila capsulata]